MQNRKTPSNTKKSRPFGNKGIIQLLIIVVMGILILGLLNVNLNVLFSKGTVKQNFKFAGEFFLNLWRDYFVYYASYLWGIWIDYIWLPAYSFFKSRLSGSPSGQ